jgi:hypothetical protein
MTLTDKHLTPLSIEVEVTDAVVPVVKVCMFHAVVTVAAFRAVAHTLSAFVVAFANV